MSHCPVISTSDEIVGTCSGIRYELAEEKYWSAILDLLRDHYVPDEVLCRSLGSTEDLTESLMLYIDRLLCESSHLCLVAIDDETNQLIGVRLNEIDKKGEEKDVTEFDLVSNPIKILRLLDELHKCVDIFQKYEVEEMLSFVMVSINQNYRQRGLAKELFLRSMRLGKLHNLRAVRGIFNSLFSQKAATKLGFESQQEYYYNEYEQDGDIVFRNTYPHVSVKLMSRLL